MDGSFAVSACPRCRVHVSLLDFAKTDARYGPLEVEHTVRQHAQRRARQEIAPETRPEEVQQEGKSKTKDPTTTHVKEISEVLNAMDPQRKGVNLFRLFINPDSFAQSVENLFYTSFLVKEGRVSLDVKDDGEIMICKLRRLCQSNFSQAQATSMTLLSKVTLPSSKP